jgi:hypothetical protein
MKLGLNLEGISGLESHAELRKQSCIIQTVLNHNIRERLDRCFGGQYLGNIVGIKVAFERKTRRQLMKDLTLELLFLLFKRFYKNTPTFDSSKITPKNTLQPLQSLC